MKKIGSAIVALLVLVSLAACSSSKLADIYSEDEVIARAKEVVEVINTLDYEAMCGEVRDDLQDQLSAETLKDAWDSTLTAAGAFDDYSKIVTMGQTSKTTGEDYAVVILVCKYESATLTYTISMDKDLKIVGMYLK